MSQKNIILLGLISMLCLESAFAKDETQKIDIQNAEKIINIGVINGNLKSTKNLWKTSALQEITLGISKEYVREQIGTPRVSIELSKIYPDVFKSVQLERYEDKDGEVQTLYNSNNNLVGLVIRQFANANSRIIRSPNLKYHIQSLTTNEWVFGENTFAQLGSGPSLTIKNEVFGKSVCQIEKYYFGRSGGYSDYYFSVWLTDDVEDNKKPEERIPNSLLIVNTDEVCLDNANDCDGTLQMLTCTWGSNFAD